MSKSDRERLERVLRAAVLAGDEAAWVLLYRGALEPLRGFILRRCGGVRDAAEEALQETWMVAVRRIRHFDPGRGSFEGWLRGIAENVVQNQGRRRRPGELPEPASIPARGEAGPGPRDRIVEVLLALPNRYRAVLRAKYVGEKLGGGDRRRLEREPEGHRVPAVPRPGGVSERLGAGGGWVMRDDHREEADLDRLLAQGLRYLGDDPDAAGALDARDEALLALTSARVRARRHRRRLALGAAVLTAFVVGFWSGSERGRSRPAVVPQAAPIQEEVEGREDRPADPRDLEARAANLAAAERAAVLEEAGDRYLAEWGDVAGALRCYRQLRELASRRSSVAGRARRQLVAGRIEIGSFRLRRILMSSKTTLKSVVALVAVTFVLTPPFLAQGVPSPEKIPQKLDAMLARAMQTNPEVLLAQAQLEQARAELNQVRLKVTQEIIEVHAHRQTLRLRIQGAQQRMEEAQQLFTSGMLSQGELRKEQVTLIESEGELASTDAQIRYLLGMGGMAALGRAQADAAAGKAPAPQRPPVPERVAKALEMPIAVHFENVTLKALLENLSKASGIVFLFHPDFGDAESTLDLDFGENPVPLRQVLLALADINGAACFAIRDYGILVVDRHDAEKMPGPVIPETTPLRP